MKAQIYVIWSNDQNYPLNTVGYFKLTGGNKVYQSPMFLMMYFAALAASDCKTIGGVNLATLNVVPDLYSVKMSFLEQITGIHILPPSLETLKLDQTRIEHPHIPESYFLLSIRISSSLFSN
ncbi:MAG: hypothetical protein ACI3YK_05850 [Eubacteriales bacterium]